MVGVIFTSTIVSDFPDKEINPSSPTNSCSEFVILSFPNNNIEFSFCPSSLKLLLKKFKLVVMIPFALIFIPKLSGISTSPIVFNNFNSPDNAGLVETRFSKTKSRLNPATSNVWSSSNHQIHHPQNLITVLLYPSNRYRTNIRICLERWHVIV